VTGLSNARPRDYEQGPLGGNASAARYIAAIAAVTALQVVGFYAIMPGWASWPWSVLAGLPLLVAATQVASAVVNWSITLFVPPRRVPRLDLSTGIPAEFLTLVVVPTLLPHLTAARALPRKLAQHYLANRERNLYFALLTDFCDAATAHVEGDDAILSTAVDGIQALNHRYARTNGRFLLLHRQRCWSSTERRWMGVERKRGKLADLNDVITGQAAVTDRFSSVIGPVPILRCVRYVITLDDDTDLSPGAARSLVSAIAHPLNQAHYDQALRRVVRGYGILQPRTDLVGYGPGASHLSRTMSGRAAVDQYTGDVSDVYQDLFGEGSFVGKGIYDVDAVVRALDGVFPASRILSHDLLEGCYARSGLIGDVIVTERAPQHYHNEIFRRSRWVRGDWQAATWVLPTVPVASGGKIPNPLSALSRWKLLDNLRRSLVKPSLLALAVLAVFAPPSLLVGPILAVVAVPLAPVVIHLAGMLRHGRNVRRAVDDLPELWRQTRLAGADFVFLPYEGVVYATAIVRTWFRLAVGRRLLDWVSTGEVAGRAVGLSGYVARMWPAPLLGLALVGRFVIQPGPATLVLLLPGLAWLAAPVLAELISRPRGESTPAASRRSDPAWAGLLSER
jgi:cyclic beta-1,2-glucan synthetase